jgi:ribonucleotide monophosphatase NagD (HAD superfamily)
MVNRERWLGIRGMLCDLNGVFYVGEQPLSGANEAIAALQLRGMPYRFLTNNTTLSLGSLARQLQTMGLAIQASEILSVPAAAVLYLRQIGSPTCELVVQEDVRQDFAEFRQP